MSTQRRFEGNTLAEVLGVVQKRYGNEARITSAQRIRTGGIFGFFQKERFEVVIDLSEKPASEKKSNEKKSNENVTTDSINSILDLAQQINAEESKRQETPKETKSQEEKQTLSTEGPRFADVLSRVAFQADLQTPNDKELKRNTVAENEQKPSRPEAIETVSLDDVFGGEMDKQMTPPRLQSHSQTQFESISTRIPEVKTRVSDHPLAKLGLPISYLENTKSAFDSIPELTSLLEKKLPIMPTIRPSRGSIIAVVGKIESAYEVVCDLAVEFGRPEQEVVIASQNAKIAGRTTTIDSIDAARNAHRSWSRRHRVTIVAIVAQPGGRDATWADNILTVLEPIATFGVVEATRKATDVSSWIASLGGIDAIVLEGFDETLSPADVLHVGIPVYQIDQKKATPDLWALLLTEHLESEKSKVNKSLNAEYIS